MDILTFITGLVEHSAWPTAAVAICFILKRSIEGLFARLSKAQHKDTVLDFNAEIQRVAATIEGSVSIADAIPHDPLGLISEAEKRIYDALEGLNVQADAERVKVLAKHHANLQIRSGYLEIYHLIFGSQISLLQALNVQSSPVESEFLISFYESARQQYEEFYKTYSFESYINFLKSVGLINTENGRYFLTVLGRGFLTFLSESGINPNRAF